LTRFGWILSGHVKRPVRKTIKRKGGRSLGKGTGREDDGEEEKGKKEKWHLDLETWRISICF
jgi:hypothetical protein